MLRLAGTVFFLTVSSAEMTVYFLLAALAQDFHTRHIARNSSLLEATASLWKVNEAKKDYFIVFFVTKEDDLVFTQVRLKGLRRLTERHGGLDDRY